MGTKARLTDAGFRRLEALVSVSRKVGGANVRQGPPTNGVTQKGIEDEALRLVCTFSRCYAVPIALD